LQKARRGRGARGDSGRREKTVEVYKGHGTERRGMIKPGSK